MANVEVTQGQTLVVLSATAADMRVDQLQAIAIYNLPTEAERVTSLYVNLVTASNTTPIEISQLNVMAVVRGKIDNPKLRAWTYTLDGHDYYVLKLGTDGKTFVFDLSTNQWSWWSSDQSVRWRTSVGMNWVSSGNIPLMHGSNIVVGDDSYGVLWVLDPEKGQDDSLLGEEEIPYPRVATGQMISRDRIFVPVYSVDLTASLGEPALTANSVTLEYSDDQGHTYVTADEPRTVEEGNYDQEFSWRSLGLVRAPGRLFRISDNGSFARIDGLDVNL